MAAHRYTTHDKIGDAASGSPKGSFARQNLSIESANVATELCVVGQVQSAPATASLHCPPTGHFFQTADWERRVRNRPSASQRLIVPLCLERGDCVRALDVFSHLPKFETCAVLARYECRNQWSTSKKGVRNMLNFDTAQETRGSTCDLPALTTPFKRARWRAVAYESSEASECRVPSEIATACRMGAWAGGVWSIDGDAVKGW